MTYPQPILAMPALALLAAGLAGLAGRAAACGSADDCSQLGACAAGACACLRGWRGASCGELDVAPAAPLAAGSQLWPLPAATRAGEASAWGFTVALDPADKLFHAVATVACGASGVLGSGGGDSWLAHLTSAAEDGPFAFAGMFAPQTTFGPHVVVLPGGAGFALYFRVNLLVNATLCAGGGADPLPNASTLAASLVPPAALTSGDPEKGTSIWVAWAAAFAGPWSVQKVDIVNGDRGGDVIHKSNPSVQVLQAPVGSARFAMAYRLNLPGVGEVNAVALADDFRGPFRCITNVTAQPGEDPFFFQVPGQDPNIGHVILHDGPFGYHNVCFFSLHPARRVAHTYRSRQAAARPRPDPDHPTVTHTPTHTLPRTVRPPRWLKLEFEGEYVPPRLYPERLAHGRQRAPA